MAVNDIVAVMNNDTILCGCFELSPSYVTRVLRSVKDISLYVVCNKELNYVSYIKQCISERKCPISHTGNYFQLTSGGETVYISFEARIIHEKRISEQVFAQCAKQNTLVIPSIWNCVC